MKPKKLNKAILLLFISLSLVLYSINVYSQSEQDCSSIDKENLQKLCYIDLAENTENPNICQNLGPYSGNCYYKVAIKTSDIVLCEKADAFIGECYFDFAEKFDDVNLCDKARSKKIECYYQFAIKHNNTEFCDKADDKISDCYFTLAKKLNDKSLCMKSGSLKEDCLCANDEYLQENECVKLKCDKGEEATGHKCNRICEEGRAYKDGKCIEKCSYWFTERGFTSYWDSAWCGGSKESKVLFDFSIEIPLLFFIFTVIILLKNINIVKRALRYTRSGFISTGINHIFVYLNIWVFIILFNSEPGTIIRYFFDNYYRPKASFYLLFILPFIIGVSTHLLTGFIRKRKYNYFFLIENVLFSLGFTIFYRFIVSINFFLEEFYLENFLNTPLMIILTNLPGGIFYLWGYAYLILRFLIAWIAFFLILTIFRYIFNWKSIIINVKKHLPIFLKQYIYYLTIFIPLLIFIPLAGFAGSSMYFPDVLFFTLGLQNLERLGVDTILATTQEFYTSLIYAFLWAAIFLLAKFSINFIIKIKKNEKRKKT